MITLSVVMEPTLGGDGTLGPRGMAEPRGTQAVVKWVVIGRGHSWRTTL